MFGAITGTSGPASLVDAPFSFRFRVTSRKSRLYHTDAVAERLGAAVGRRTGATMLAAAPAAALAFPPGEPWRASLPWPENPS